MTFSLGWRDYAIGVLVVGIVFVSMWNKSLRRETDEIGWRALIAETELKKIKTQIAEHTESITEITKTPDGTTTTKITKIVDKTKVSDESADKSKVSREEATHKVVKNDRSRYTIHALYDVFGGADRRSDRVTAGVGARLGDLPVFGVVSGRHTQDGFVVSTGVQLEW